MDVLRLFPLFSLAGIGCEGTDCKATLEEWCASRDCAPLPEDISPPSGDDYLHFECGGLLGLREADVKHGVVYDSFYDPALADPVAGTLGELVGGANYYGGVDTKCPVGTYGEAPPECIDFDGPFLCGVWTLRPRVEVEPCS